MQFLPDIFGRRPDLDPLRGRGEQIGLTVHSVPNEAPADVPARLLQPREVAKAIRQAQLRLLQAAHRLRAATLRLQHRQHGVQRVPKSAHTRRVRRPVSLRKQLPEKKPRPQQQTLKTNRSGSRLRLIVIMTVISC